MPATANIRVSMPVPFPALVSGGGPITLQKSNGQWFIGFTFNGLQSILPIAGSFPTDYVFAWDDVGKTFIKISLSNLLAAFNVVAGTARLQRAVTASPIVVAANDQILNCNIAGAVANVPLPQAATRAGLPLSFEDLGQATAHPITFVPFAGDTIVGANSGLNYQLNMNLQGVTFVPFTDGTNTGWKVS